MTKGQLELLSLPLHLSLLIETSSRPNIDLSFETAKDLFDKFWQHKRRAIGKRLGSLGDDWNGIIDTLCQRMDEDQSLSVGDDALDEFSQQSIDVMVSEYVLIRDNKRFSFFHQSFFDYAFARSFVRRKKRLSELIFNDEQVLFRRAQVRQILVYERDADRGRYLADLQLLISDHRVRPHLRQVVVAYLAALEDPSTDEWQVVAPHVTTQTREMPGGSGGDGFIPVLGSGFSIHSVRFNDGLRAKIGGC